MRLRELPGWCVDPRLWRWLRRRRLRSSGPFSSLALCTSSTWLFLSWSLPNKTTITSIGLSLSTVARTRRQPGCPLTDEWIRKLWYIYTVEYYSATKRNDFESVELRWMNLAPVIQHEVNQKDKNKYHVLTYIYGIWKNGTDKPICRAGMETGTYRMDLRTQQGKRVGQTGRVAVDTYIYYHM